MNNPVNSDNKEANFNHIGYEEILNDNDILNFFQAGCYWQSSKTKIQQGWILHISIIRAEFSSLTKRIIPWLKEKKIPFRIPLNNTIHNNLLNGELGYEQLGKIISVYVEDQILVSNVAIHLINLTQGFKGPEVPTDMHLGGLVYTRFGSFDAFSSMKKKYVIDNNNNLFEDNYLIPFKLEPWQDWPFYDIKKPISPLRNNILKKNYYLKEIIKNDARGRVMIAVYKKGFLNYSKCIIKEGKYAMASDELGRDIADRLNWQKEVHINLEKKITIPKFIDLFTENNNTYLAIEYINGITLNKKIGSIMNGKSWLDLPIDDKFKILNILISVVDICERLHDNKYVHRDINISNFLITPQNNVVGIDLELSFNIKDKKPYPPFSIGTIGYMSPEQFQYQYPTFEQDIYSIGALIFVSIIRIPLHKFNVQSVEHLKECLLFFTGNENFATLIISCLNYSANLRPTILEIKRGLLDYSQEIKTCEEPSLKSPDISTKIIQECILAFSNITMLSPEGYWASLSTPNEGYADNKKEERFISWGFSQGIGGILFMLGIGSIYDLSLSPIEKLIEHNYKFIVDNYLANQQEITPGLFQDGTGVGLGIAALINAKIIESTKENLGYLMNCFSNIPNKFNISEGISGYGLAVLKFPNVIPQKFHLACINTCIKITLENQLPDGNWPIEITGNKQIGTLPPGFNDGLAGICYFLFEYYITNKDNSVLNQAFKGLNKLIKMSTRKEGKIRWAGEKEEYSINNGLYQFALPFMRAFEITNDITYKNILENILFQYPNRIVIDNFTQNNGISGLGEIYLEAYKLFKESHWLDRADWIYNILVHSKWGKGIDSYWQNEFLTTPSPDLLMGNAGIIHFLIYYSNIDKMSSILSATRTKI